MKGSLPLVSVAFFLLSPAKAVAQAEIPESFKGVVPLHPGAKLTAATKVEGGARAHFVSHAEPKELIAFYEKKMVEKGWTLGMKMQLPRGASAVLEKGDRVLNVMAVSLSEGKTRLVVTLGEE